MNDGVNAIKARTLKLVDAQNVLGVGDRSSRGMVWYGKAQAIIPMLGSTADDPHQLPIEWKGGSMSWVDWRHIRKMQKQCSSNSFFYC